MVSFHVAMGTGMACNLGPMYGIYMTFFPGLIYALFGSSFHNSVGAFAPSAALVGVAVARTRLISESNGLLNSTGETVSFAMVAPEHVETAVTIAFFAGIVQVRSFKQLHMRSVNFRLLYLVSKADHCGSVAEKTKYEGKTKIG